MKWSEVKVGQRYELGFKIVINGEAAIGIKVHEKITKTTGIFTDRIVEGSLFLKDGTFTNERREVFFDAIKQLWSPSVEETERLDRESETRKLLLSCIEDRINHLAKVCEQYSVPYRVNPSKTNIIIGVEHLADNEKLEELSESLANLITSNLFHLSEF